MKKYLFKDLNPSSTIKACSDYLKGWIETHGPDALTIDDVYDILLDNDEYYYTVKGEYIEEEI